MTIKYVGEPLKRIASLLLCFCLLTAFIPTTPAEAAGVSSSFLNNCSDSYKSGVYYSNLAAVNLSGNLGVDLVAVANSQKGYHEGNSWSDINGSSTGNANYTEYNKWYPVGAQSWCNLFVSWCCAAAGISTSIAPKNPFYLAKWRNCGANVYSWKDYSSGSVTPKAGDIIIFGTATTNSKTGSALSDSYTHIGIITGYSSGTFYTIEGNTSDKVWNQSYTPNTNTGSVSSSRYVHAIIQPTYNQCSHNSAYYNDGRCTLCGAWLPNANDNASCTVGTYRVVSGKTAYFRAHPYRVSDETIGELLGSLSAGTQVYVTGAVVNGLGNTWYKVSYGGHEGYIVNDSIEYVSAAASTLSINPASTSYTIVQGNSCSVTGSIDSNYNITSVTATLDGNQYVNLTPNAKTVNIGATGSGQINSFKGKELSVGTHTIVITATDASPKTVTKQITITVTGNTEPETFAISYNDNGGTGGPGRQTFVYSNGESITTVVPTREGYTFECWKDDTTGYDYYPNDSIPFLWENRSLTAQWRINQYYLEFNFYLDGFYTPDFSDYGYVELYINGENRGQIHGDWWEQFPYGTQYEFKPAYTEPGYSYSGVRTGTISGWIGTSDVKVQFDYSTNYYDLDLNGLLDGTEAWDISSYGTVDVIINGNVYVSNSDFHGFNWPYGTTYEIRNIRPANGYSYDGISDIAYEGYVAGGRSGTITGNTSVRLIFHTSPTSIDENPEPAIFGGHTYYYFSTPVTWYDAKTICENMGGHLVTVTSEEETTFLVNLVRQRSGEEYGCYIWLGATDRDSEGTWKWVTGEELTCTKWFTDEPNNSVWNDEGAENYAQFYTWQGDWNDTNGSNRMPFVCEVDSASYTLKFDANGGTGSMDSLTPQYKEHVTIPDCAFKKSGCAFTCWNLRRDLDAYWYVYGYGFLSESEIKEKGLSKTQYLPETTMWIGGYDGSESYTFVAVWAQPDLVLPAALTSIEKEAFAGGAFRFVKLPEKAVSIGWHAFADCPNLAYIYIPATVTEIDAETFGKATNLTIIGTSGSTAETFARAHGFAFLVG